MTGTSTRWFAGHPIIPYFVCAFAISWLGALAVAAPHLLYRQHLSKLTGILMFPAMLLGPCLSGIIMTRVVAPQNGLRNLRARVFSLPFEKRWLAVLLIPPLFVVSVLLILKAFVSTDYAPNFFPLGVLFGLPAGLLEEIGWTGFAFPVMSANGRPWIASLGLGFLWSLWHLPVIDFLGAASPHGAYLVPFFLAFTLAMTAMRVLISWLYANTRSVLAAQFLHISSTGSLVVFGPPGVTARQEVFWYAVYGVTLWVGLLALAGRFGASLLANDRGL